MVEVSGSRGDVLPAQKAGIDAKVPLVCGVTVTTVAEDVLVQPVPIVTV